MDRLLTSLHTPTEGWKQHYPVDEELRMTQSFEQFNQAVRTSEFKIQHPGDVDDDEPHVYVDDHVKVFDENTPFNYEEQPSAAVIDDHNKMVDFESSMLFDLPKIPMVDRYESNSDDSDHKWNEDDNHNDDDTTIGPPFYDYADRNIMGRSLVGKKSKHVSPSVRQRRGALSHWHQKQTKWFSSIYEINWEKKFKELVAYKEQNGHTRVPQSHPTPLGTWVKNQRQWQRDPGCKYYKQYRHDRLNTIGFEWRVNQKDKVAWEEKFQELVAFKKLNGHTRVPESHPTPLGIWVKDQR